MPGGDIHCNQCSCLTLKFVVGGSILQTNIEGSREWMMPVASPVAVSI